MKEHVHDKECCQCGHPNRCCCDCDCEKIYKLAMKIIHKHVQFVIKMILMKCEDCLMEV